MKSEQESVWKEKVMTYFNLLQQHLPGMTEANDIKPVSEYSISRSKFESKTS
jgi:hypothetical protein